MLEHLNLRAHHLSEKDALEAVEMAVVADDIRKKPMKMETLISEGASTNSVGQYQRIIIARAIAGHPRILVLDDSRIAAVVACLVHLLSVSSLRR